MVESMAVDSKVLSTIGVTLVSTHIRDGWNIHGLVTLAHIIVAVCSIVLSDHSITDLPQHFDVFIVADRHVTYGTNDFVISIVREAVVIVNHELIIEL